MPRIESLIAEQWRRAHEERERWRAIGTCTDPADRETTERAISSFYRRLGREPPAFLWIDGPLSFCVAVSEPQLDDSVMYQIDAELHWQLRIRLGYQLGVHFDADLITRLRDQLADELSGRDFHFEDMLGAQLRTQRVVPNLLLPAYWNAQKCWWVAWYAVARDVVGDRYGAADSLLLDEWESLVRSAGWWFPSEKVCFCAERHRVLSFDRDHRLHCATGPAIECRDGYRVYAWHGTQVPAEWIEQPESLTPETVFAEWNMERRRAAADILGWMKLLEALDARVIDEHPDPEIGTLYAVDLPGAPGARILRMRCGTGRWFAQPVPEHIQTAMAAQEWKWRLGPDEYHPEVRT